MTVSARVKLDITGVDGDIKENIALYIQAIDESDYSVSSQFRLQVKNEIKQALMPFGYYRPSITFSLKEQGKDNHLVTALVDTGEATLYKEVDFRILGAGKDDPAFKPIYKLLPKVGDQVNHQRYTQIKTQLENLSIQRGYFFARFEVRQLDVAPELSQAFLTLHFNTGKRYHIGKITYSGNQIQESRLRSMLNFHQGDPYLASEIGRYNYSLSNTNWFSSVLVKGDIENIGENELPIEIRLKPAKKNILETGAGYASDAGARIKFAWNKPWLNDQGHSMTSRVFWSAPKTEVSAAYKVPLENVNKDYYQWPIGYQHIDNEDTQSEEYKMGIERHWILDSGWHRTLGLTWMWDDFTQGIQSDQTSYVVPSISYARTKMDKNQPAMFGDKYNLSVDGAEAFLSDGYFFRVQASGAWLQGFTPNQRGIAALRSGAIAIDTISDLPPALRFFAGGSNSIRGYDFDGIAPKDSGGYLKGGKYKLTSTLEYQYRVMGDWWVASFVDSGSVWNKTPDYYTGVGLGVRWVSPIGPLRLDFAYGLDNDDDDGGFHFYFALGPEF